jgi:hypothetical protein
MKTLGLLVLGAAGGGALAYGALYLYLVRVWMKGS